MCPFGTGTELCRSVECLFSITPLPRRPATTREENAAAVVDAEASFHGMPLAARSRIHV